MLLLFYAFFLDDISVRDNLKTTLMKMESPWATDSFLLLTWYQGRCWNTLQSRAMFLKSVLHAPVLDCKMFVTNPQQDTYRHTESESEQGHLYHTLSQTDTSQAKDVYVHQVLQIAENTWIINCWYSSLNTSSQHLQWVLAKSSPCTCLSVFSSPLMQLLSFWIQCHQFLVFSLLALFHTPHSVY